MPLNPTSIQTQIESIISSTEKLPQPEAKTEFSKQLAQVIIAAIESATITVKPGLIQVQGSPSAQANVTPIIIEDGLS